MKNINVFKTTLLGALLATSCGLYANPLPSYKGIPKSDPKFAQFMQKNNNKLVQLDLTIKDPSEYDDISYGYKGVSPTFYIPPKGKLYYDIYIDCDKIDNSNAENSIQRCSPYVKWNTQTGRLTGKFKVLDKGKNGMGNRLFMLVAVK